MKKGVACHSSGGLAYGEIVILTRGNGEHENVERMVRERDENGLAVVEPETASLSA